jgi:hypothetical protein
MTSENMEKMKYIQFEIWARLNLIKDEHVEAVIAGLEEYSASLDDKMEEN